MFEKPETRTICYLECFDVEILRLKLTLYPDFTDKMTLIHLTSTYCLDIDLPLFGKCQFQSENINIKYRLCARV